MYKSLNQVFLLLFRLTFSRYLIDDNGTLGTKDLMGGFLKCPKKILKMGHFKSFEHKKVGYSEKKKHVIDIEMGKEPKMNIFEGISIYPSHAF